MCMVSMVMDGYTPWDGDKDNPNIRPYIRPVQEPLDITKWIQGVSREEFDKLKAEVQELKKLIEAAVKFDKNTGQPNCHNDKKLELLKAMADALGVDLGDLKV